MWCVLSASGESDHHRNTGCSYLSATESPSIKLQGKRAKDYFHQEEANRLNLGQWAHVQFYFVCPPPTWTALIRDSVRDSSTAPLLLLLQ